MSSLLFCNVAIDKALLKLCKKLLCQTHFLVQHDVNLVSNTVFCVQNIRGHGCDREVNRLCYHSCLCNSFLANKQETPLSLSFD